jgi:hypothetical protein
MLAQLKFEMAIVFMTVDLSSFQLMAHGGAFMYVPIARSARPAVKVQAALAREGSTLTCNGHRVLAGNTGVLLRPDPPMISSRSRSEGTR